MPLAQPQLKASVKLALQAVKAETVANPNATEDEIIDSLAEKLSLAIHNYLTAGTVNTVVEGTSPSGAVTGTGTGTIS